MSRTYNYKNYVIFKDKNKGYVLYNMLKPFKDGHTHLRNFQLAKRVAYHESNRKIPKDFTSYLLISLIRVTNDEEYKSKINKLYLEKKERKIKR